MKLGKMFKPTSLPTLCVNLSTAFLLVACGTSSQLDGGRLDGASSDAGNRGVDGGASDDAGALSDGGVATDAGATDAAVMAVDAGGAMMDAGSSDAGLPVTCDVTSCGTATCGRSPCGYSCGECAVGDYCYATGCSDLTPGGTVCRDAFGGGIIEGMEGFRRCDTDPSLLQRCMCSGGGPDTWFGCGACQRVVLDGDRGSRCSSDDQCASGLPCHVSIGLCGENCDRGRPTPCPASTACSIPGDVAGVCLDTCTTCGGDECGADFECAPNADEDTVCIARSYSWARCP